MIHCDFLWRGCNFGQTIPHLKVFFTKLYLYIFVQKVTLGWFLFVTFAFLKSNNNNLVTQLRIKTTVRTKTSFFLLSPHYLHLCLLSPSAHTYILTIQCWRHRMRVGCVGGRKGKTDCKKDMSWCDSALALRDSAKTHAILKAYHHCYML